MTTTPARKPKLRKCALKGCGQRYIPRMPWQKYHSNACRNRAFDKRNPRVRVSRLRELRELINSERL